MKKHLLLCGLAAFVAFVSVTPSRAAEMSDVPIPSWEFSGGTSTNLSVEQVSDDGGNPFQFDVNASAGYFLTPHWELGVGAAVYMNTGGNLEGHRTSMSFMAGPTFNFSKDAANSFFVSGRAGFDVYYFGDSDRTYYPFAFSAGIGRRVELVHHVSWTPELIFAGHTRATDDGGYVTGRLNYELALFQFSVLL